MEEIVADSTAFSISWPDVPRNNFTVGFEAVSHHLHALPPIGARRFLRAGSCSLAFLTNKSDAMEAYFLLRDGGTPLGV